jgi:very-short-patch-repair endonuclease
MDNKYVCPKCGREFDKQTQLSGHSNVHSKKFVAKIEKLLAGLNASRGGSACKFCGKILSTSSSLGGHIIGCKLNPNRRTKGHPQSIASRKNLSLRRKEFLKKNKNKHNWSLYHKQESAPEKEFKSILTDLKIQFVQYYIPAESKRFFEIDFALLDKKIGFEINGNQHYTKVGKLRKYYLNRKNYLESVGWITIDIPYLLCYHKDKIIDMLKENEILSQ